MDDATLDTDTDTDTDVDEEHTRLLMYRHAHAAATDRLEVVATLRAGLALVTAGPDGSDDGIGRPSFLHVTEAASTDLMMSQTNCRAALSALSQPVQRSLREFVG